MIFAQEFNLHPWDTERLTLAEFDAFTATADRIVRESKKGASGG